MKKFTFTIAAFLACYCCVHAQKTRIGFTVGHTFSHFSFKPDPLFTGQGNSNEGDKIKSRLKPGFTAGVVWDIPVNRKFSIQPGLNFVQKGGTLVDYDEFTEDEKAKMTLNFLELPVNTVIYLNGFKGSYFLGTGITPAIALSGKVKEQYEGEEESVDLEFGENDEDDFRSFDLGINFLAGYEFKSKCIIAVSYSFGFANLSNVPGKFNTRYIGVKFGYMLKAR